MTMAVLTPPQAPAMPPPRPAPQDSSALHVFAKLTSASAFFLMIAGGLVTSTGSGLAVPDWPLSFGKFFPPMVGGVLFEHGHRVIAGIVGLLTFALTAWVLAKETRPAVRLLACAASAAIIIQAGLGGLTVMLRLPPAVSIAHACLAQAVFCMLLALAQTTSPIDLSAAPKTVPDRLWLTGAAAASAVYLQLILGAIFRHTGEGILLHIVWAFVVLAAAGRMVYKTFESRPVSALAAPAALLTLLVPGQILLGLGTFGLPSSAQAGLHARAALATAHVAVGAVILATAVLWTLRARRLR